LGIDETSEVEVTLQDGRVVRGFPDSRASQQGGLVIWVADPSSDEARQMGPFSIERILSVRRIVESTD